MKRKKKKMKNRQTSVVSTRQTSVVSTKAGECFFRTYRCFFDYLKKNRDTYFKAFKSIMVDSLEETLINDIIEEISWINTPDRRSRIFYHANYAQGVSAFLGKIKNACERQKMNVVLLDCVGEYKNSFQVLNEKLLNAGQDLFTKEHELNEDAYNDIKKAFLRELKGNPNGKKVVLLDHMDRFFIEQFEKRIELKSTTGKPETNDFSLYNIFKLREFWCHAIIRLNNEGINCIATVQTSLEAIFGEFSTKREEEDFWGRNRVSSIWNGKISAYSGGYFCEIRKYLNGKVGNGDFQHDRVSTECNACDFYFKEDKNDVSRSPYLNNSISKLVKIAKDGPWLFCLSLYHAVKSTGDSRGSCANWNRKLKHYYRNMDRSRGERSLLQDYLRALPLYIGEMVASCDSYAQPQKICEALEGEWETTNQQIQKNVEGLLKIYDKRYKKMSKRYKKMSKGSAAISEDKVLMKDRLVKRKLKKKLPKIMKSPEGKNQLAKIIVNQNIFSREEDEGDDGNKKYVYFATSFFHYIYSDEKIKIKK